MQYVAFRADASTTLGGGHVRRCLSLARALRDCGVRTVFISRAIDQVGPALLSDQPLEVRWLLGPLEDDAQETATALRDVYPAWLVVDHYLLDRRWHESLHSRPGCKLAVIDDLADRPLACDLLVDPNDPDAEAAYRPLLASPAKVLGGPHFALLDPLYAVAPRHVVRDEVKSIGIFMGTTDPTGACLPALRGCREVAGFTGAIEVVCSPLAPGYEPLAQACAASPGTRLLTALPDLAAFFARHDLQVGAGGGATWERCCIGPPTVACQVAENQLATLPRLEAAGAGVWARGEGDLAQSIGAIVAALLPDTDRRRSLNGAALRLVDGRGCLRVAAVLACAAGAPLHMRAADAGDEACLLAWANDPVTRANAFNPERIAADQHARWFASRLASPDACRLFIAGAANGELVGQVRFDRTPPGWEISYALAPHFRQLGLGTRLLETALAQMPPALFSGRVRTDNEVSARVFRKLGFNETEAEDQRGRHRVFSRTSIKR